MEGGGSEGVRELPGRSGPPRVPMHSSLSLPPAPPPLSHCCPDTCGYLQRWQYGRCAEQGRTGQGRAMSVRRYRGPCSGYRMWYLLARVKIQSCSIGSNSLLPTGAGSVQGKTRAALYRYSCACMQAGCCDSASEAAAVGRV